MIPVLAGVDGEHGLKGGGLYRSRSSAGALVERGRLLGNGGPSSTN